MTQGQLIRSAEDEHQRRLVLRGGPCEFAHVAGQIDDAEGRNVAVVLGDGGGAAAIRGGEDAELRTVFVAAPGVDAGVDAAGGAPPLPQPGQRDLAAELFREVAAVLRRRLAGDPGDGVLRRVRRPDVAVVVPEGDMFDAGVEHGAVTSALIRRQGLPEAQILLHRDLVTRDLERAADLDGAVGAHRLVCGDVDESRFDALRRSEIEAQRLRQRHEERYGQEPAVLAGEGRLPAAGGELQSLRLAAVEHDRLGLAVFGAEFGARPAGGGAGHFQLAGPGVDPLGQAAQRRVGGDGVREAASPADAQLRQRLADGAVVARHEFERQPVAEDVAVYFADALRTAHRRIGDAPQQFQRRVVVVDHQNAVPRRLGAYRDPGGGVRDLRRGDGPVVAAQRHAGVLAVLIVVLRHGKQVVRVELLLKALPQPRPAPRQQRRQHRQRDQRPAAHQLHGAVDQIWRVGAHRVAVQIIVDVFEELADALVAFAAVSGHRLERDLLDLARDRLPRKRRAPRRNRRGSGDQLPQLLLPEIGRIRRRPPRQYGVEDPPQTVYVGEFVRFAPRARQQLRRHERGGAAQRPRAVARGLAAQLHPGESEVGAVFAVLRHAPVHDQHFAVVADHQVRRLEIAVDDSAVVRESHAVARRDEDLQQPPERITLFHRLVAVRQLGDDPPQRLAVYALHREVHPRALEDSDAVHRHDVGMADLRGGARLPDEGADPLGHPAVGGAEHLDRDFAHQPRLAPGKDRAHPAEADGLKIAVVLGSVALRQPEAAAQLLRRERLARFARIDEQRGVVAGQRRRIFAVFGIFRHAESLPFDLVSPGKLTPQLRFGKRRGRISGKKRRIAGVFPRLSADFGADLIFGRIMVY